MKKRKPLISFLGKKFIHLIRNLWWKFLRLISLVFYLCPINKNKITAYNFHGNGYGDNPKYLVEELLKENKYEIIWFVKNKNEEFPKGVKKVKYRSLASLYHLITARLWLDTIRNSPRPLFKRKNQYYIQMWHGGIALKGMEKDVEDALPKSYIKCAKKDGKIADFMLSNCALRTEIINRAFWFNGKVLEFGTPRDDILFYPNQDEINKLKQKYHIRDKKIVLYAPTFRNDKSFYEKLKFNVLKLKQALEKKFNENFVVCIKLHPNDANLNNLDLFKDAIDLTKEADSQLILSACDVVISDYSSMLLDFTLTKRLAITYAPDYDEYINKERKLYFDLKTCGIPFAETFDELIEIINKFDQSEYVEKIKKFHDYFGIFENGTSSKQIKKYLIEKGILL